MSPKDMPGSRAGKIWDLRELRGTDGYLDPETEQFLEAELGRKKETKELAADPPSGFRQLSLYEQIAAGT